MAGRPKGTGGATPRRMTMEQIEALPALITSDEYAQITGMGPKNVTKLCRQGMIDGAVKSGGRWVMSKAKALEALGLM